MDQPVPAVGSDGGKGSVKVLLRKVKYILPGLFPRKIVRHNADHAAAIKAMYLYAMRFRSLSNTPSEIPANVYAIWQEAAYSDHTMTEDQRKIIHSYMVETAKAAWAEADWKKRLLIQYRIAL